MSWNILPKGNLQYFLQKLKDKLATVALTGSYNDLSNKPTIPTVNNKTIKVQVNSTDFTNNTFTLNQSSDKTIDIPVTKSDVGLGNVPNVTTNNQTPTFSQASSRANIASGEKLSVIFGKIMRWFADLKDLAFIAKDGNTTTYLRGDGTWVTFPTIPTVNDATLTIKKNGTTVKTFTANASSNVTCDITVPTALSDLTDDATHRIVTDTEKSTWNAKGSSNLTLGETSSTAYRGDRGKSAYTHASDSGKTTTATSSGLYKIACTNQGHVASLTAVVKADITGLGIPAQDTTYEVKSAASGGTAESLVTTGEKYTWNNKVNKAGDTMTGNLTLRRDSAKTDAEDPDTPAQLALQARWTDNSTGGAGEQKSSTGYIRAYPDRAGNGANLVITPGGNTFIGSGEAANSHYNAIINQGSVRGQEVMYITSDNNLFINATGNTIANRRGFRMDTNSGNPRVIPAGPDSNGVDTIQNNIGMIGHPSYKWKYGYFTYLNNNTVPVTSSEGGDTLALKSDIDWRGPVSITASGTNISSYANYNELYFTACFDSSYKIYASMVIPMLDIKRITNDQRIFRTGWNQSNTVGAELDIKTTAIPATGATTTWDIRVAVSGYVNNGTAATLSDIQMYYR